MTVSKVLNNNCIISRDTNGKEIILMGPGLGFGIKKGDPVASDKIRKVFRLERSVSSKFQNVIKDIPTRYIFAADKVITYIKANTDIKISDTIYVTLTDHIWVAAERIKKKDKFDDILLVNVKGLYRKEYEIALHAAEILTESLGIPFDEAEANFITLHIINAEMDCEMTYVHKITRIVAAIGDYVEKTLEVDTENNSIAFDRFLVHCRFLIQKVVTGKKPEDLQFSGFIKKLIFKGGEKNDRLQRCVDGIVDLIKAECNYEINEDEQFFLYIHLAKLEMHKK